MKADKFMETRNKIVRERKFSTFSLEKVPQDNIYEYCVNAWFKPVATEFFNLEKDIKCVVVAVAQYWNDEADDAVHTAILPLSEEFTSWQDCFRFSKNKFASRRYYRDDDKREFGEIDKYDLITKANEAVFGDKYRNAPYPNNTTEYINAFASFCKEGGSQENDTMENYNPILVFYKNDDGSIRVRDLGNVIRLLRD